MRDSTAPGDSLPVPQFLYGTAWKEDSTQRLVKLALAQGFRGIDTANQRRHYHEAGVGAAIRAAIAAGVVTRDNLFLQTKFTFRRGQDDRLPYDPAASIATQVAQSFASSLEHLGVTTVDSYVLHGPTQRAGLADDDWAAWRAMEAIHNSGRTKWLGVSNVTLEQLQAICREARILPRFVQNRCYASMCWDRDVREFCRRSEMVYQGFSLLTANRDALAHPDLTRIARRYNRTASQIIFRFALDVEMLPLTGTTNPAHMREDLDIFDFRLDEPEIKCIETIAAP